MDSGLLTAADGCGRYGVSALTRAFAAGTPNATPQVTMTVAEPT